MATPQGDGSIILTTAIDQSGLKKGIGSIKSMAKTATKAFLAVGAASATATIAIAKASVDAFAEYEQLVGGVETLFKGSSKKLIEYANQAYKTAGLSANQYMATVTGFSASLLQSLGGDTEKAADIANQALIDMSDNANKMGTSMERIQMAYQSFARGQYQLLDNLSLGYGGTKSEMERLLKDAQALTGVKYDIKNLADVYTAIHVIQENLGIAGTTAEESEKTISGSAATMKAAWQNVLTAISGGGDLDAALNNLLSSFTTFFHNLLPTIETALDGIVVAIEKLGPEIVDSLANAIIRALPRLINAVGSMISTLAQSLSEGLTQAFSGVEAGASVDNITESLEEQSDQIAESTENQDALTDSVKGTEKEAKKTLASFDEISILSAGEEPIDAGAIGQAGGAAAIDGVAGGITASAPTIAEAISSLLPTLIESVLGLITNIAMQLPSIISPILDALPGVVETIAQQLPILIPSLITGIVNAVVLIIERLDEITQPLIDALPDIIVSLVEAIVANLPAFISGLITLIMLVVEQTPKILQGLISALPSIISLVVQAILNNLPLIISGLMNVVSGLVASLPSIFLSLIEAVPATLMGIWDGLWKAFGNIGEWFATLFQGAWDSITNIFSGAGEWFGRIWEDIKGAFAFVGEFFGGIWNTIKKQFSEIGNKIGDAVSGAFKTAINWVLEKAIGIINGFIKNINGAIGIINLIPGVDIKKINELEVPKLAQGTVVPPNREFLAVLGDNKKEHEIVSPVSTMKQAFMEAMIEMGGNFGGGNTEVVLEIDGREFGRAVVEQGNKENRRIGTRLVIA